ncbi:ABC transporter permease, partial [Candidatus Woesebacteria bacterium]|nr:ABC transporter permease [Candidatus Woesebacteria bacterium]
TVGGMMIGISVIVFLISIGYGLQSLVVNRVARLDELKQSDVTTAPGSKIKLNDETIATFQGIDGVDQVLPVINVVGKVNYNNSGTDMAVYGVTKDYLQQSAIKPVIGRIFENNETVSSSTKTTETALESEQKKAVVAELGDKVADVTFRVGPDTWLIVRDQASKNGKILGYINNEIGEIKGTEIWGDSYIDNDGNGKLGVRPDGSQLGLWLKVKVPLWQQENDEYLPLLDNEGNQVYADGYIAKITVEITQFDNRVLGNTIDVTNSDWVSLQDDLPEVQNVTIVQMAQGENEAVVNRAFLELLQIPENEILGKTFEVTFVVTGILLDSNEQKIQSEPITYTVIGVTPDNKTPLFYVPFVDIRSLGVQNFSQIKIVAHDESDLSAIRQKIEALGFNTFSVVDTVAQIESLFSSVRVIMGVLGFVALSISTLGMFNTLTVSLIERTREVGLLKAMGMKSSEVKDLFFAESILMGSLGGIIGLALGFVSGKILEIALSLFSIVKGIGPITIVNIPLPFTVSILLLSFLVGVVTGVYPAYRATKISALNALRYE